MTVPGSAGGPVLLFDGECGLCSALVRLLLRVDRRGTLRFAPLQGPAAQAYLRDRGLPARDFSTLVFVEHWPGPGHALRRAGVAGALRACGGVGRPLGTMIAAVPRSLGDAAYRVAARLRRRLGESPRPPRPEWAQRFID